MLKCPDMFEFQFTCEVICADRKLHWIKRIGYFHTHAIFLEMLQIWSDLDSMCGGTYQYFQQPEDWTINAQKQPLPKDFRFSGYFTLHMNSQMFHQDNLHAQPGSIWEEMQTSNVP